VNHTTSALDYHHKGEVRSFFQIVLFSGLVNLHKREVHSGNHIAFALDFITTRERFINFAMYF